jgi:DNA-binding PadR family transcriptional regulator
MRNVFLGLLARKPAHGYELKQLVEGLFGAVLPTPGVGQIYTTLQRLERGGLVRSAPVAQEGRPDKRVYELTPRGATAVEEWLDTPVAAPDLREEFFVKLAVQQPSGGDRHADDADQASRRDPQALIDDQRRTYLISLRRMNELVAAMDAAGNEIGSLLAEGMILHLEADLKWLDLCEDRLVTGGTR